MTKLTTKSKAKQINKNNKIIPKNLEKKQYNESFEELKNSIKNANEKESC